MIGDDSNNTNNEDMKQLINKRGQIKAALTRFKTFFENYPPESSLTQLKNRLARVMGCLSEYETVQSQLEILDTTGTQMHDRDTFESMYFDITAQAEDCINSKTPSPQTAENIPTNSTHQLATPPINTLQVRLPAISLPSFSGNYDQCISFSDSFQALIHNNETLTDIQKLHYLQSSLKGEASKVINSLELSASNYAVAWQLLEDRYKNERLIIQKHVKALFELPYLDRESAANIRQLLDGMLSHMRALNALKQPTEHWDTLVIHLVTSKLGTLTCREWEKTTHPKTLPTLKQLTDFLEHRCQILESSSRDKPVSTASNNKVQFSRPPKQSCFVGQDDRCRLCIGSHPIYQCQELLSLSHEQRVQTMQSGLCFNCLRPGHSVGQCKSGGCKKCKRKHNTLLHVETQSSEKSQSDMTVHTCHGTASNAEKTQVMLSTALVDIVGPYGHTVKCRALLDSGSQSSFITEAVALQLRLPRHNQSVTITSITGNKVNSSCSVQACIRSKLSNYSTNLQFLVIPKITSCIPADTVTIQNFKIPSNISLADPTFNMPGRIDILIGQEIFYDLLCIGQIKTTGMPTIQKTRLGWIVGGRYMTSAHALSPSTCHLSTTDTISNQLQAFWQLEELNVKKQLTEVEQLCEDHFTAHTTRDSDGRYIVSMPLRDDPGQLGESRDVAVKRLQQVERRFARNPDLRKQYRKFMTEYVQLGHMEEIEAPNKSATKAEYYLPHHPVIKADSSTTKLRIVFDASAKTSSGRSLNDIQLVGPTIQNDSTTIILRFRMHTYVMTADLEKMYRQVKIDPTQRNLLQIVWRDDPSLTIKTFQLKTVSLPRLELCAALLLSELVVHVRQSLEISSKYITYWTDSTVVLAWLNAEPARWSTFVANRVSKIQETTQQGIWRHVPTGDNPADLISRGTRANALTMCSLWWNGPTWLKEASNQWPRTKQSQEKMPKERSSKITSLVSRQDPTTELTNDLMNKFSSFSKIIRVLAYCRRFINNLIKRKTNSHESGPLSVDELAGAKTYLLKKVQEQAFSKEIMVLRGASEDAARLKALIALSPFIDKDGLIKVGGRLEKSSLSYDAKHQILLPKGHRISELIATEEHTRQLHCGPQTLLYAIRQQYWPLGGRNLTRMITHKCLRCFKANPKQMQQLMGTLPDSRVTPSRALRSTGVDYCGPFHVKHSKKRGVNTTKAYVAVFVCLATKAVHLEMVSDLTTDTFLGALRRFVSRRGICADIYSDNGKTFVGANRELQELRNFFTNEAASIVKAAFNEGVNWHFIPPYAPHMGGLWEAAVKSLKYHPRRIMGIAILTCEEFNTILTQVEAVRNSRPLTPMSNDPSDLSVLTPAHFLTGGSLKALPEPSLVHIPEHRVSRWQRGQQLLQHFWERWRSEYLCNLQQRGKWRSSQPSIEIGTLVLLKDDHLPPLSWSMGRVTQFHPGKDNLVRVVTVRTTSGDTKRTLNKLCPLPID